MDRRTVGGGYHGANKSRRLANPVFIFPTHIHHLLISSVVKITKIYFFRHSGQNRIRKTRKLKEIPAVNAGLR